MGAPRFVQPRPRSAAGSRATLALWLGIAAIAVCVLSLGLLAIATLLAAIAAVGLGRKARRDGAGSGGLIIGLAGMALSLLAILFWVVFVIVGGLTLEFLDFWRPLEDWLELPAPDGPTDPDPRII